MSDDTADPPNVVMIFVDDSPDVAGRPRSVAETVADDLQENARPVGRIE